MPVELISALSAAGTFIVITASAIAALIQLRHIRAGNQIATLTEFRETIESRDVMEAQRFVYWELPKRLRDAAEFKKATSWPLRGDYEQITKLTYFFENMGAFIKNGIIDQKIACDVWGYVCLRNWNALAPLTTCLRNALDAPSLWENFEYFAVLSKRYWDARPNGSYPRNVPRMPEDRSILELHDTAPQGWIANDDGQ